MKQAIHNGNIPDWKNDKQFFVKDEKYNYKLEDNWYLVYFHYTQPKTFEDNLKNIPCRFSKIQFNLYFTSITELRKEKIQRICSLKD